MTTQSIRSISPGARSARFADLPDILTPHDVSAFLRLGGTRSTMRSSGKRSRAPVWPENPHHERPPCESFSAETSYNILAWTAERIHGKTKHLGVKKYMIVYDVPPQNGKARQQKREILRGVTKHEAESFLAKRIESVARGEYTAHADMTMSDLFDKFMTHKAKRLEATTIDRYKGIIAPIFARRLERCV